MERWCGKTVVITGASSGIGQVLAKRLANHGMKVIALARREHRLKALEEEKTKGRIKGLKCDVTNEDEVKGAFDWIEKNWGAVHVLVNNAGVLLKNPATDVDIKKVCQTLNTNVVGCLAAWKYFLASVQKHKTEFAHALFVLSLAGHEILQVPGLADYCASKHALKVFTHSIRNELALMKSKIRITSISPGLVATEMSDEFVTQFADAETPILKSEDIVDCIEFALGAPQHVNISELIVQPTCESVIASVARLLNKTI